jgi:molybdopterin-binding protein
MTSIITKGSYKNLELEVGKQVHVVVKASNVIIGAE